METQEYSHQLSQMWQGLVRKPHLTWHSYGYVQPYWICSDGEMRGFGGTPLEAYEDWKWVRTE